MFYVQPGCSKQNTTSTRWNDIQQSYVSIGLQFVMTSVNKYVIIFIERKHYGGNNPQYSDIVTCGMNNMDLCGGVLLAG